MTGSSSSSSSASSSSSSTQLEFKINYLNCYIIRLSTFFIHIIIRFFIDKISSIEQYSSWNDTSSQKVTNFEISCEYILGFCCVKKKIKKKLTSELQGHGVLQVHTFIQFIFIFWYIWWIKEIEERIIGNLF